MLHTNMVICQSVDPSRKRGHLHFDGYSRRLSLYDEDGKEVPLDEDIQLLFEDPRSTLSADFIMEIEFSAQAPLRGKVTVHDLLFLNGQSLVHFPYRKRLYELMRTFHLNTSTGFVRPAFFAISKIGVPYNPFDKNKPFNHKAFIHEAINQKLHVDVRILEDGSQYYPDTDCGTWCRVVFGPV